MFSSMLDYKHFKLDFSRLLQEALNAGATSPNETKGKNDKLTPLPALHFRGGAPEKEA